MKDSEMALKLAKLILENQMREIAYQSELELYRIDSHPIPWKEKVERSTAELLSEEPYRNRIAEIRASFEEAKPDEVLKTLYISLFRRP